jgi:tryptophan synthase alpha chain
MNSQHGNPADLTGCQGVQLLENTFKQLREQGKKALIAYITAGDPSLEQTEKIVLSIAEAGANIIELGIPYSDPVADGPIIQQASQRALQAGTTVEGILTLVSKLRSRTAVPLVLMTYINPILQYGVERFMNKAYSVGVNALIIPDLPVEEWVLIEDAAHHHQIGLIPLLAPTTPAERIRKICPRARGFIYCVSLTGVTGMRTELPPQLNEFLARVRAATTLPMAVGFGIGTPQQVLHLKDHCDGVVVGSAIVNLLAEVRAKPDGLAQIRNYIASLRQALDS